MTHALPLRVLALLAAFAFSLPAVSQEDDHEGGLTGTGIYGVVVEKEPLVVNGQTIKALGAAITADPIGMASAQDIEAGNVVALHVNPSASGIDAVSVQRVFALIGPIQAISDDELTIMGTDIAISQAEMPAYQSGDWVAVSGFWRETDLLATRVDAVAPQAFAQMTGTYFNPAKGQMPHFGASQLFGLNTNELEQGTVLTVTGNPTATGMDVVGQRVGLFDQTVRVVSAQGYLSRPKADGFYTLLGSGLIAFNGNPPMTVSADPVVFCGVQGLLFKPDVTSTSDTDRAMLDLLGC